MSLTNCLNRNWNEPRVADWLRSINAGQYVDLFKGERCFVPRRDHAAKPLLANNITGANLMDIDQEILKEIGVNKVGDRVRINQQAKMFRKNEYLRKRQTERVSRYSVLFIHKLTISTEGRNRCRPACQYFAGYSLAQSTQVGALTATTPAAGKTHVARRRSRKRSGFKGEDDELRQSLPPCVSLP